MAVEAKAGRKATNERKVRAQERLERGEDMAGRVLPLPSVASPSQGGRQVSQQGDSGRLSSCSAP